MANLIDLAREAFANRNYQIAVGIYEQCLCDNGQLLLHNNNKLELYFGYGDALARSGRIRDSFDVYAYISTHLLGYNVPLDKLKHLTFALLDSVTMTLQSGDNLATATTHRILSSSLGTASGIVASNSSIVEQSNMFSSASGSVKPISYVDSLCCAICEDVLKCPVTTVCGHTFCRKCCIGQTYCRICDKKFSTYGDNFKSDILVLRLVEKWWSAELIATKSNDEASIYMNRNALDEALKACNESLEKCPNSYQGLLLRSEVLYRLNHFQSALADADNALKSRPTSYKAHLRRAYALFGLGSIEEALLSHCLAAACLSRTTSSSYSSTLRQDVAKILQRLFMPSMRISSGAISAPYNVSTRRRHRIQYNGTTKHTNSIVATIDLPPSTIVTNSNNNNNVINTNCNNNMKINNFITNDEDYYYYYDDDNTNSSSCGEDESISRRRHHKNKRRRKHNNGHISSTTSIEWQCHYNKITNNSRQEGIPRHVRIRNLVDRINQEILKIKRVDPSKCFNLQVAPQSIDLSDFECVLCYRTLWKPICTPCGHTYCLVCLDRCLDYSSNCPLCKSSLVDEYHQQHTRFTTNATTTAYQSQLLSSHSTISQSPPLSPSPPASFSLSRKCETRFLEIAMQRFIPVAYKKRQTQEIENEPSVPIFICTTAFPNVPCPLFVYESRYRLMIRRAIESGEKQFGIAQPHSGRQRYSDFGTMLDIRDCVLLKDGCSILSTVGCRRFRVIARKDKDGYDTAKVEYIDDEPVSKDRMQLVADLNINVNDKAITWYNSLPDHTKEEILKSFGCMPKLETNWETITDGPAWAWYIIAILPLSQQLKVEILATTNLEKRLRAIDKTLEYVAAQKRRSICLVSCEGLQACQQIDCCQRATSSNHNLDDQTNTTANHHVTGFLL